MGPGGPQSGSKVESLGRLSIVKSLKGVVGVREGCRIGATNPLPSSWKPPLRHKPSLTVNKVSGGLTLFPCPKGFGSLVRSVGREREAPIDTVVG